jgi:hypothetical protein
MSNIILLHAAREIRDAENTEQAYHAMILSMDKVELLEEMVRFQEERSQVGHLTITMMTRGRILFKALEENAETQELKILTRTYRRHLDLEISEFRRKNLGS